MAASQRQACSDSAGDKSGRFIAPQRRRLHYRPTRVVNLRSAAIAWLKTAKMAGDKSAPAEPFDHKRPTRGEPTALKGRRK